MVYSYIFEPRAQSEYEEAIKWYKVRSIAAGENFEIAIDDKLK